MALIGNGSGSEPPVQSADQKKKKEINIQALAERILQLLKEEARLERERLGPPRYR